MQQVVLVVMVILLILMVVNHLMAEQDVLTQMVTPVVQVEVRVGKDKQVVQATLVDIPLQKVLMVETFIMPVEEAEELQELGVTEEHLGEMVEMVHNG